MTDLPAIRDLEEGDLDWMAAQEVEIFGASAWSRDAIGTDFESGFRRFRGIEDGGRLVGYSVYGPEADLFHLLNLVVIRGARRRGLGRALVEDFLDEARRLGFGEVSLEVAETNSAAIAMYERFGFSVVRVRPRYYQPEDVDALVLGLRLEGP